MPSELWLEREVERLTGLLQEAEEALVHERMDRERIINEEVDRITSDWERRFPPVEDPHPALGGWEPVRDRDYGEPAIYSHRTD